MPSVRRVLVRGSHLRAGAAALGLALLAACGGKNPGDVPPEKLVNRPLITPGLAGQQIAVLPLTLLLVDEQMAAVAPFTDRRRALTWGDSLVGRSLQDRAPEVNWVLPAELRKLARRSPGVVVDPDQMGQAILRAPSLKVTPDPLRSELRSLIAVAGGRFVLVPAGVNLERTPEGLVKASLWLVIVDARTGLIPFRTLAEGEAATPPAAVGVALASVLPVEGLGK